MATIPFELFITFVGIALVIGFLGIWLGMKRISGAPFITIFAGMLLFPFIVMTDDISTGNIITNTNNMIRETTIEHMNQQTSSGSTILRAGNNIIIGEKIVNQNSILHMKEIDSISLSLSKTGSPTGTAIIGIWSSIYVPTSSNYLYTVGRLDVSTITTSRVLYTFTNNTYYYPLNFEQVVGIFYDAGSAGNEINVFSNATASSFDDTNSIFSRYNSGWLDGSSQDMRMIIRLMSVDEQTSYVNTPNNYDFNQNEIWAFMIFLSAMFILVGTYIQIQKW